MPINMWAASEVYSIGYHIIIPIFITIEIINSTFCFIVLLRPKLREVHINQYLQFLTILELLSSFCAIPATIGSNFLCTSSTYAMAYYQAHFGWKLVDSFRYLFLYGLIWVSYDRFIATWYPVKFKKDKFNRMVKTRLSVTTLCIGLLSVPFLCIGYVVENYENLIFYRFGLGYIEHPLTKKNRLIVYQYLIPILPCVILFLLSLGLLLSLFKKVTVSENRNLMYSVISVLILNTIYMIFYLCGVFILPYDCGTSKTVNEVLIMIVKESFFLMFHFVAMCVLFALNRTYRVELIQVIESIPMIRHLSGHNRAVTGRNKPSHIRLEYLKRDSNFV
ncbi:unnamed protein product [Meganyctiphanes norvegica]|uniref:G-protein coupled receptors family 1 profile domain-containing protein n=1 Tax=Meganyctiphanes norvegica TaxID=48144 RepID=A0AAV2Q4X9_MEGNR